MPAKPIALHTPGLFPLPLRVLTACTLLASTALTATLASLSLLSIPTLLAADIDSDSYREAEAEIEAESFTTTTTPPAESASSTQKHYDISKLTSLSLTVAQFRALHALDRRLLRTGTYLVAALFACCCAATSYPSASASASASASTLRSASSARRASWKLFALASASTLAALGYEGLVMRPVRMAVTERVHYRARRDLERNDGGDEAGLVRRWGVLNWGRVGLVGLGVVFGGWGVGGDN